MSASLTRCLCSTEGVCSCLSVPSVVWVCSHTVHLLLPKGLLQAGCNSGETFAAALNRAPFPTWHGKTASWRLRFVCAG